MKKIFLAAVALAAIASTASVQAAPRQHVAAVQQYSQPFNGAQFFADEANRGN